MADSAPSPADALRHLKGLSTDIRAAVILDEKGRLVASEGDVTDPDEMGGLAARLLDDAAAATGKGDPPPRFEVSVPGGAVYAIREGKWAIALVASRSALSSLMFYDLRSALALLGTRQAA